jgi:hypothetical protein
MGGAYKGCGRPSCPLLTHKLARIVLAETHHGALSRLGCHRLFLPRRHPYRSIKPDHLAVEHLVLDDVPHERGVLLGLA